MQIKQLEGMMTESRNSDTMNIDSVSTVELVEMINREDKKVPEAIEKKKVEIAAAIDIIAEQFKCGGRLIYIGAGTSGRLGILDSSECPPTYGVSFEMVQGVMAGGQKAMFKAVEGAEDSEELAVEDLKGLNLTSKDVVCGIAASGRTPYVIGGLKYAQRIGCKTVGVTMNEGASMLAYADVKIGVGVGPEVVMGSTRMKAGTAQKLILNMLSTGAMIKFGKVYSNLMVDVQATNIKLVARARRIVMLATGVEEAVAEKVLTETKNNVKLSIMMIISGLSLAEAKAKLDANQGYIANALKN